MNQTPEERYIQLFEELADLCEKHNFGDPFSYARSKELYAAFILGHTIAPDYSGADAINSNGQEVEYKSTINKNIKGSYTGISVQSSWEEQERYLREEKIAKYPEHFFNRFEGGKLVESWRLTGDKVFDILLPKLKKKYSTVLSKKDPRLSANVTSKEIKKYGTQIL